MITHTFIKPEGTQKYQILLKILAVHAERLNPHRSVMNHWRMGRQKGRKTTERSGHPGVTPDL